MAALPDFRVSARDKPKELYEALRQLFLRTLYFYELSRCAASTLRKIVVFVEKTSLVVSSTKANQFYTLLRDK